MKVSSKVMVIEDVNGYYVKQPCGLQMTVVIPKGHRGIVKEIKKIEVAVRFETIPMDVWIPKNMLETV